LILFRKFTEKFASQDALPVSTTPASKTTAVNLPLVPMVSMMPVANNGNNIRLLTPLSELEEKNYLKVPKQNILNFSD
jgi:hypothetical protein